MRLIYLHQYFTFPNMSGGTRSYDLATQFVKNNIDVTFIKSSAAIKDIEFSEKWTYLERDGLKFWIFKNSYSQNMSKIKRIKSFILFMFFASIKICQIKADIVLATSTPLTIAIPALIKKVWSKTPFVFETRDVWPEVPIKLGYIKNNFLIFALRKFEVHIYKKASCVVPLSIGMKRDILSRTEVKNIQIIPNISEINRFKNIDIKLKLNYDFDNKKVILYAGTFGPVNNLIYVAKLAEKLLSKESNIVFLLVGDGNQKNEIMNYCKKMDIYEKNIFFANPVSKNSLPYLYSISTMGSSYVMDNEILWDNSANKFFDTLAAGIPVLVSNWKHSYEFVEDGSNGYICDVDNITEFINTINKLLTDSNLLLKMKQNAYISSQKYSEKTAFSIISKYL